MALRDIEDRLAAARALSLVLENKMTPLKDSDNVVALLPPNLEFSKFTGPLTCFSPYQNDIAAWSKQGYKCMHIIEGSFDAVIIFPTNSRDESLWLFAKAFESVRPGGTVIASSPKDFGASRLESEFSKLFESVSCESKYHCRVFWGTRGTSVPSHLSKWLELEQPRIIPDTDLVALPGCFSADAIDQGSKFLIESLTEELSGDGADLGCGYGYLTKSILQKNNKISSMDLIEIDWRALECAKINLSAESKTYNLSFKWQDARVGVPEQRYDWIIMNPAFHERGFESAALGISMIKCAAIGLRPGGRLYFVANRKLPYEGDLKRAFPHWREIAGSGNFKVIEARK